ncbi:MAG: DUF3291 domain-containing protein [Micromonosporaceae bacterium]
MARPAIDGQQVANVSIWRRSDWFLPTPQPSTALWWQPDGERPSIDHALTRGSERTRRHR